jgi:formamidopyrimidine-DNA glycosylase
MPELPEVETVCRGLAPHLVHERILQVTVRRRDLRVALPDNLETALTGKMLKRITRRAKYIEFHFDEDLVLLVHLGMSGRLLLHRTHSGDYLKHDHVVIRWTNDYTLLFNDARRFGLMALTDERSLTQHPLLKHLGVEPLGEALSGAFLYNMLHGSNAPVKSAIMDQRKLVGVGNIYACEALFRAWIHPARIADKVSRKQAELLADAIRQVLGEAIVSGGSTLRDYVRSSGDSGYFQHHFNVYGRKNLPCNICKRPIKAIRQSGRSSFFCAYCQR